MASINRRLLLLSGAAGLGACASRYQASEVAAPPEPAQPIVKPAPPPPAPRAALIAPRPVDETFFGTTVQDPYRYFEDADNAEVRLWMRQQSERARQLLDRLPQRAALAGTLARLEDALPLRVAAAQRLPGGRVVTLQRAAADDAYKLVLRPEGPGPERLLADPLALARLTGRPHAINYYSVSPDGRHVAYGLSPQGTEAAVLQVVDTTTGRPVGAAVDRAEAGRVAWSPDGRQILYHRLQPPARDAAPADKFRRSQVWRRPVGGGERQAEVVFGSDVPGLTIPPEATPSVELSADGRWAFGTLTYGVQDAIALYVAPQRGVLTGRPRWTRVFGPEARIRGWSSHGNRLFLSSWRQAPRGRLLVLDLARPQLSRARVLVDQGEMVLTATAAASDAFFLEMRDTGNVKHLYRLPHKAGAEWEEVGLPVRGSLDLHGPWGDQAVSPRLPGALIAMESWTRARRWYRIDGSGAVEPVALQPEAPAADAPPDVVVTEVRVRSHDGTEVPLTLLHRRGLSRDGSHPTLLYGYGSHGETEEPACTAARLAWVEAGGVWAVVNPRGSGIYGEDFHRAGSRADKPNGWKDFIACAEHLVRERWTSPQRLAAEGRGAGGILVGRAVTERPDLWAAAVISAGSLDMVRAELGAAGAQNVPEFGTRRTEAGFRALLAMSTYHQVRDGTAYPALLFTHGVHDPRVEVWHSTKTAARFQAATSSGRPVLLRLDYEAGHGVGSTKQQSLSERADIHAFLLWQLGVAAHQPG